MNNTCKFILKEFAMYKVVGTYEVSLNTYNHYVNIYEAIDINTGKIRFCIDDYDYQRTGKRIKIINEDLNEKTVYTRRQLSRKKFLELKLLAMEQELHRQELLKAQFERWNEEKKELLSTIKKLVDNNSILELKELLSEE
jgi:post-segregation antitoxin (ccd killing protein)